MRQRRKKRRVKERTQLKRIMTIPLSRKRRGKKERTS